MIYQVNDLKNACTGSWGRYCSLFFLQPKETDQTFCTLLKLWAEKGWGGGGGSGGRGGEDPRMKVGVG